jgi:hypothetical protein
MSSSDLTICFAILNELIGFFVVFPGCRVRSAHERAAARTGERHRRAQPRGPHAAREGSFCSRIPLRILAFVYRPCSSAVDVLSQVAEIKDYSRKADSKDAELQAVRLELAEVRAAKPGEVKLRTEIGQLQYVSLLPLGCSLLLPLLLLARLSDVGGDSD